MADRIPDLDDLLKSIRDEGKPQSSSALAVIPKAEKKGTDVVDEDIDPLILRLLGLSDVFDIDYDTYKTLLREKMAAGRMPGSQMPTEEIELLTNEFKRVKGKTGRFKVKAQKIKAESFVAKKKEPTTAKKPLKALPGTVGPKPAQIKPAAEPKEEKVDQSMKLLAGKISDANNNIKKIVDTDKKKNKLDGKREERGRIETEKTRKTIREDRAESGRMTSGLSNALSSAIAPVKGILDVIGDFLKRFLVGTAIMELIKFLENPQAYINGIVNWLNGVIEKIESGLRDVVKNIIIAPINNVINGVNGGIKSMVDQINGLIGKIPGNIIPKMDLSKMQIGIVDPSTVDNIISLPRIPMFGTAQPPSTQQPGQPATQSASGTPLSGPPGQTLATGAKASWYNPGLGGMNSGTGKADPNARTSTGENYDKSKFTAAAFPSLISKLPKNMSYSAPGFPGGRTLARGQAFNVIVTDSKTGKQAVVRINDVGSGVAGQDPKRMMDFSVATRDYFGAGGGPYTVQMAPPGSKPGPITKTSIPSPTRTTPTAAPPSTSAAPSQGQGKMVTFGGQTFYQKPDGTLTHSSSAPASVKSQQPTPSVAKVVAAKPNVPPPAAPGTGGVTAIPIPVASGNQQAQQTNTSTANQYGTPTFSAYDKTNPSFLVIKSIYNIVG